MKYELEKDLQQRNKELIKIIEPYYHNVQEEWVANSNRRVPLRFGSMLTQHIYTALARYPLMTQSEFEMIDVVDLETYYQYYMEFISEYSLYEVASTKQLFCSYMRITVAKFNFLMESCTDDNLKEYANYINDNINGLIYASAETGNIDSRSALTRGKIKNDGQNLVQVKEEVNINVSQAETPEQLLAKAQKNFLLATKKTI